MRVLYFLLLFFPSILTATEIVFKSHAKVTGTWIRLQDIARIQAESPEEKQRLEEVFFGKAPAFEEHKILKREYLSRRLQQFGYLKNECHIVFPSKGVRVRHGNTQNRLEDVEFRTLLFLEKFYKDFSRTELHLEDPENQLDNLPAGILSVDVLSLNDLPRHSGEVYLMLKILCGEKKLQGVFRGNIRLFRQEVFSSRRLGMRLNVQESQLALREVEVTKNLLPGYADLQEVVKHKTARIIPPNTRILQGDILEPIAIEKGTQVELIQESNKGIRIRLFAKALEEGRMGDEIQFEMPTGFHVKGKVINSRQAQLLGRREGPAVKKIIIGGDQ
jgi:flagella basal body P-ring formation protein FlgA